MCFFMTHPCFLGNGVSVFSFPHISALGPLCKHVNEASLLHSSCAGTPPNTATPCLDMVGPWMIAVSMQDNSFTPLQQTLAVQLRSAFAPATVQAPTGWGDAACAAAMASRVTA
jgi:hypothetical protein